VHALLCADELGDSLAEKDTTIENCEYSK